MPLTVTGFSFLCPVFGLNTDLIPDFPQPLTLMSSTMMGLSGMVNPNSFM